MVSQRAFVCSLALALLLSAFAPEGNAHLVDYNSHEVPCTSCPASPPFAPPTSPNPVTDPVFNTTITRRTAAILILKLVFQWAMRKTVGSPLAA